MSVSYYGDFHDYEVGKLKSLGNIRFEYDRSGRLFKINGKDLSYRHSRKPDRDRWYSRPSKPVPDSHGSARKQHSRRAALADHRPQGGRPGLPNRRPAPRIVAEMEINNITIYVTEGRRPW